MTAIIFGLIACKALTLGLTTYFSVIYFIYFAAAFSILIALSGYDLRHKIIPDQLVFAFIVLAVFSPFITSTTHYFGSTWIDHGVAGLTLAALFAFLWAISRGRWMGFGDAKLSLGMGLLLGLSTGVAAVMIAFWSGAIIGLLSLLLRRTTLTMKSEIPFAPFLVLGTAIAFFFSIDLSVLARLFS